MSCTIVSLAPYPLREKKSTVYPQVFRMNAAKRDDFEILVIGDNHISYTYIDEKRGSFKNSISSKELASAIVFDHVQAMICIDAGCKPGLFWIEDDLSKMTKEEIKKKYAEEFDKNLKMQIAWMHRLVKTADDEWKKNGQHKFITSLQRLACDYLGLNREWNVAIDDQLQKECQFCTKYISARAVKCPHCNEIVDFAAYEKLTSKKAS